MKRPGDFAWVLVGLGAFLWAVGGWCCKWTRRFVWPWSVVVVALWYRVSWWRALIYGVLSTVVLSLGYSPERYGPLSISLVGAAYGACAWILRPDWAWHFWRRAWWYPVLTAGVVAGVFFMSGRWDAFTWKFSELSIGAVQGWVTAHALMAHQREVG